MRANAANLIHTNNVSLYFRAFLTTLVVLWAMAVLILVMLKPPEHATVYVTLLFNVLSFLLGAWFGRAGSGKKLEPLGDFVLQDTTRQAMDLARDTVTRASMSEV